MEIELENGKNYFNDTIVFHIQLNLKTQQKKGEKTQ